MAKEEDLAPRASALASGWTVEGQNAEERNASEAAAEGSQREAPGDAAAGLRQSGELAGEPAEPLNETPAQKTQASNVTLVLLGFVGGLYLLYTWVWLSWANYYSSMNDLLAESSGSLGGVMQQLVFWISPLAPVLWFVSVLVLQRGKAAWRVALWLAVGAVVLLPLPMLGGGA